MLHTSPRSSNSGLVQVCDYGAPIVNWGIIGFAVFYTTFAHPPSSSGSEASRISLTQFYLIMLMNALTSTLDASKALGEVAGHAARICDFVQAMAALTPQAPLPASLSAVVSAASEPLLQRNADEAPLFYPLPCPSPAASNEAFVTSAAALSSSSLLQQQSAITPRAGGGWLTALMPMQELLPMRSEPAVLTSAFGTALPTELREQSAMLLSPTAARFHSGEELEVSVHQLADGSQLRDVVGNVFPDLPLHGTVHAVCTYQAVQASAMRQRQVRKWMQAAELAQLLTCAAYSLLYTPGTLTARVQAIVCGICFSG